ncbi:MAG: hypothetical protein JWL76_1127 [Thermoleophilia bacterium]|nr:hypothetical protein [Thermoleophilia bacterium]
MNAEMVGAAASTAAHAAGDAAKRSLSLADVEVLDTLVSSMPKARQLQIGRQLLDDQRVYASPIVKGPLAAIKSGLADVTAQDVRITSVLANVRNSIDQELGRMAGIVEPTVLVGTEYHPDYGVVGSIRDNLNMLAAFKVI